MTDWRMERAASRAEAEVVAEEEGEERQREEVVGSVASYSLRFSVVVPDKC